MTQVLQLLLPLFLSGSIFGTVQASKDDTYYKLGSGNPNVYQDMYWKDAENVLEDLDEFQSLYVSFEHCAWSWMNYGNSNEDGKDVEENDYWYMGTVPPFGANVAFSLYGALAGQSFSGCGKDTFINSFYTRTGFEEFIYSMKYAGGSSFSYNDYSGYSSECQGGYGVGCDYSHGFAVHKYSTNECNPKYYNGVSDQMKSLNQAMNNAQCIKIYDANYKQNYWDGYNYTISGTSLELLAYSQACFYENYWSPDGECPDPYGKIAFYQQNFNRGQSQSMRQDPFQQYTLQVAESKRLATYGTLLMVSALIVFAVGLIYPTVQTKAPEIDRRVQMGIKAISKSTSKLRDLALNRSSDHQQSNMNADKQDPDSDYIPSPTQQNTQANEAVSSSFQPPVVEAAVEEPADPTPVPSVASVDEEKDGIFRDSNLVEANEAPATTSSKALGRFRKFFGSGQKRSS